MSLSDYQSKRKFDATPEPEGGEPAGSGPLRFVVQKHAASRLHYDFRLEMGGILKSWAVPKGPSLNPEDKHLAMQTEDHPFDYRNFEGVIPEGNYGAGTVMIWDEGTYEPVAWDKKTGETLTLTREEQENAARHGEHAGHITFILHGTKLNGEFALIKMQHADEEGAWLLVKANKDKWAGDTDILAQDRSAVSGRSLDEITAAGAATWTRAPGLDEVPKAKIPNIVKPMLATLSDKPFDDPTWLYEIKYDGYRAIATITPGGVRLRSRNDQDFLAKYPPITQALEAIKGTSAVLDGEIVVLDSAGVSHFEALQQYGEAGGTLAYYVFDLLHLDGHDLTGLPLTERKRLLREWLPAGDVIRYSDHIIEHGKDFFKLAESQGLEGIIAKAAASPYLPGKRSSYWLKLKTHARQEAVIGGFTAPQGSREAFGALILGVYDEAGELQYIGHTGGGFDDRTLAEVHAQLKPLIRKTSPFAAKFPVNAPATWVTPKLVCEVKFQEWTSTGQMRQPIFVGMRTDKPAREIRRELPAAEIKTPAAKSKAEPAKSSAGTQRAPIHNSDKIYWPDTGFTKGQLAGYYETVADTILPYLKDRPESLHRYPQGITGEDFYQKNYESAPTWLDTIIITSEPENRDLQYVLCNDLDALMYLVNLGCIDFNPWNSRTKTQDKADWCVIDLDPEGVDFEAVITVARAVHDTLEAAHILSYPKTSGATGIHIYIPMGAQYGYDQVRDFAHIIAQLVNAKLPQLTSIERSPAKRQERVYLDYLQNRNHQTLAAPYSVRPRPGMPVSTPLDWSEVKPGLHPSQFTALNTPARIAAVGDLWKPVIGPGIDLRKALEGLG